MRIIDDLISSLDKDSVVHEVHACAFWTAVVSKRCGLASTFRDAHPHHKKVRRVGTLEGMPTLELAEYAKSDNPLEASIGMAAINSLIEIDESRCVIDNALNILMDKGKDKNVAVVGHFPWIPKLRVVARKLWVLEQTPQAGDLPAEAAEDILPKADVVAITGTSFINHTIEKLLDLSKGSFIVMVGPTSPLSPILFDWGVDVISGTMVIEPEKVVKYISQGAIFRQIEGIKLLNMVKKH
jgi:uncharacterized protein (DUF4213/DUF364 family)